MLEAMRKLQQQEEADQFSSCSETSDQNSGSKPKDSVGLNKVLDADGKENGVERKGSLSVGAKLLSVALLLCLIVGVVAMIAGRS